MTFTIEPSAPTRDGGGLPRAGSTDAAVRAGREPELSIIDRYLLEQRTMTAVDRFARTHDDDLLPANAVVYRDLIPSAAPGTGQQYAFEVDLDACSGCKACVSACHSLNGLDEGESFRSVGTLVSATSPWQQTVTTACHHCVDPACLNGCPVDAYEKDPLTGIVRHLDDQCIGCSYCTLMCPYDVPRLNAELGIVRKCDLCSDRLAEGEAPACVQGCPTSAISVTIVDVAEAIVAAAADGAALVPLAPPSKVTVPTTRYRSSRPLDADAVPADHFSVQRSHAHPPLAVMLVLTQLAVGAFVLAWLVDGVAAPALASVIRPYEAGLAVGVGLLAIAASTLHLGRPRHAWRAVIGVRHSWLSREIVVVGAFAGLAFLYSVAAWRGGTSGLVRAVGGAVVVAGLSTVGCSTMIYVVTRRHWWRFSHTAPKFVLTSVVTGAAAVMVAALAAAAAEGSAPVRHAVLDDVVHPLAALLIAAAAVKLLAEASIFRHLRDDQPTELRRTAMLLRDDLHAVTLVRYLGGVVGGVLLPLVLLGSGGWATPSLLPELLLAVASLVAATAGELCERWQFFAASTAPRMPGGLA